MFFEKLAVARVNRQTPPISDVPDGCNATSRLLKRQIVDEDLASEEVFPGGPYAYRTDTL